MQVSQRTVNLFISREGPGEWEGQDRDGKSLGGEARGTKVGVQEEGGGGAGVRGTEHDCGSPRRSRRCKLAPGTALGVPSAVLLVANLYLGQVHSTEFSLRMVLLGIFLQRQK